MKNINIIILIMIFNNTLVFGDLDLDFSFYKSKNIICVDNINSQNVKNKYLINISKFYNSNIIDFIFHINKKYNVLNKTIIIKDTTITDEEEGVFYNFNNDSLQINAIKLTCKYNYKYDFVVLICFDSLSKFKDLLYNTDIKNKNLYTRINNIKINKNMKIF